MQDARWMRWMHTVAAGLLLSLATAAAGQDVPFIGVVDQDNVEVRAGAGRTFYVVGNLRKGQIVKVDKIIFGWHQIEAPEGTTSYVLRKDVDAKGDGKTGVVNTDRAPVKAAAVTGPGESYRRQVDLMRGDTVEILGEEGSYYKIKPPTNAFVYVAPGAIRRATPAEIASLRQSEPEASVTPPAPPTPPAQREPAPTRPVEAATNPDEALSLAGGPSIEDLVRSSPPVPTDAGNDSASAEPDESQTTAAATTPDQGSDAPGPRLGGASQEAIDKAFEIRPDSPSLRALDERLKAALALPLEEQPTDELLQLYRQQHADPQLSGLDREIVKFRIATLERNAALARGLRELREARQQVQTSKAQEKPVEALTGPVTYAAVGQLTASSVYDGVTLPRLYRVVAPGGGRTIAYIQPTAVPDAARLLGRIVGVAGPMRFDPALKANIIEAKRIDLFEKAQPDATVGAVESAAIVTP